MKPYKYKGEYVRDENGDKLKRLTKPKISAIPNSYEKFMSFSIGYIKFIDSLKFMGSSLDKLAANLYDNAHEREHDLRRDPDDSRLHEHEPCKAHDKLKIFNCMKKEFPNPYELLCQKGHYPYEWVDDISKLKYKGIPPIEAFYNKLTQKRLTPEEYDHVIKVYITLGCKMFEDYRITY